jgi:hypothetical protein
VTPEDWDALAEPDLESTDLEGFGCIDLGWKIDTTGIGVLLWGTRRAAGVTDTVVLEPPVDEAQIVRRSLDRHERYPNFAAG